MTRKILVVKRKIIFPKEAFQGFLPFSYINLIEPILNSYEYLERNDQLENDLANLQIIPYIWLINKEEKKAFIYKRALGKGDYKEKRHLNKISGGIGGHIDKEEIQPNDPIMDAAIREMHEELIMENYPKIEFIGYINDDSNIYNAVHFGIAGVAKTNLKATPSDGMAEGQFFTIDEIEKIFSDPTNEVEQWTKITWPIIRDNYLSDNS